MMRDEGAKILITGTGRSGTHFTSKVLQKLGMDMPHERMGVDGTVSWKHIRGGRFEVVGKGRVQEVCDSCFSTVLHQVRHPLKVISSMQTFGISSWTYMEKFIDLDLDAPPLIKGMQGWVQWNELVEEKAVWRFQIEQIAVVFDQLCYHCGIPDQTMPAIPREGRDSRSKRYKPISWLDLRKADLSLASQVQEKASLYGYGDIATSPIQKSTHKRKWFRCRKGGG